MVAIIYPAAYVLGKDWYPGWADRESETILQSGEGDLRLSVLRLSPPPLLAAGQHYSCVRDIDRAPRRRFFLSFLCQDSRVNGAGAAGRGRDIARSLEWIPVWGAEFPQAREGSKETDTL